MSIYYTFIRSLEITTHITRKITLFIATSLIVCLSCSSVYSQNRLSGPVELPKFENVAIREVFDVLRQQSILFSYNSSLLDLDKEVSMAPYQGLLIDYLEKLLGEKYSFKEANSHIIITYAPQRMDVSTVDIDTTKNNRTMISGYVKDIRTNLPVGLVSVYDRTAFQGATLTGNNGYFELDIKHPTNTVTIALSKENYRDTMLVLILPVEILQASKGKRIGYYHANDSDKTISNSAFGRFFTSSRQRIQNLNLGGFFVYSPFQVSMTPGLSTHGLFNSQVLNKFSLNIIGGYTAGVTGAELAGGFNVNQYNMHGVQLAGLSNVVGGNTSGFQAAGFGNVGLNKLTGVQLAGVWNSADTVVLGLQLAGGINRAKKVKGIQVAGVMNMATGDAGNQLAGGLNIASKVQGVQVAIVNIADSSDYPIGIFNWVKNGSRQLALGIDESGFTALNFKSGGRVMYSVLGAGTYLNNDTFKYGLEIGIGARLVRKPSFTLAAELVQRTHFDKDFNYKATNRSSLRIIPAIHLSRHLQAYVAPSLTYADALHPEPGAKGVIWKFWKTDQTRNTFHGGGTIGLIYAF